MIDDTQHFVGGKIIKGTEWAGGAARTLLGDAKSGKQTLAGRAVGSVIEIGGGVIGLGMQYRSIQNRAAGQKSALDEAFNAAEVDWVDVVTKSTNGRGVDVIMDLVGGNYLSGDVVVAARLGRINLVGLVAGARAELDMRMVLNKRLILRGTVLRAGPGGTQ